LQRAWWHPQMGHIPYVPSDKYGPQSLRGEFPPFTWLRIPEEAPRKGSTLGPKKLRGQRAGRGDEGAETVEFAIIVVLLVTLLYGIVSLGLTLAAKETLTDAAADGARAGIVATSTAINPTPAQTQAAQISAAENTAANDVAWLGRGKCGDSGSGTIITCHAAEGACASNAGQTCLTVTVAYNYATSPLIPAAPGLNILEPNTITSVSTLQVSTPTS
jgi:Flp pilus assembly protein TadG